MLVAELAQQVERGIIPFGALELAQCGQSLELR
jgi:hypothetical protein